MVSLYGYSVDLTVQQMQLIALGGFLALATIASWTSARLWFRTRHLESHIGTLYQEIETLRHDLAPDGGWAEAPTASVDAVFDPTDVAEEHLAPDLEREPAAVYQPDVRRLAQQLGVQSPEAIERLLSGSLSLGAAARQMGTGRQEARLLQWLHGGGALNG